MLAPLGGLAPPPAGNPGSAPAYIVENRYDFVKHEKWTVVESVPLNLCKNREPMHFVGFKDDISPFRYLHLCKKIQIPWATF